MGWSRSRGGSPWQTRIMLAAVPPCAITQLRVAPQSPRLGVFYDGESGERAGWIVFRNVGATCGLPLRPRLTVWSRQRQTTLAGGPRPLRVLRRGAKAVVEAVWGNWCPVILPAQVRVTLPGGSVLL